MNKNNKTRETKTTIAHRFGVLQAEFGKLKTSDERRDYRAKLNNRDLLLLRKLNSDSSLIFESSISKDKLDFEVDKKGQEITPLSRYKKISNLITNNIEELPTYNASIQLNPLSIKCPDICPFKLTCGKFSPDIDYPIVSSGIKRNQITDEIKFYSKIGLFQKFTSNTPKFWQAEVTDEIKKTYYIVRSKGYSISYARQLSKLEAFKIGAIYSETWKSIQNNYKSKKNCSCSECFLGREYNCLNGELKEYKPRFESLAKLEVQQDLNSVFLAEFVSKKSKLQAGEFIKRIYNLCKDETDARIVNLTLNGKSQIEIGNTVKLEVSNIYLRLVKIGVKYNKQFNTKYTK